MKIARRQYILGFPPILVVCAVAVCAFFFALQPLDIVIRHVKDDCFYYLQTARNIVLGYGSTFDRINQTNGYHPLWMLNLLPIYAILPDQPLLALRVVLLLVAFYHVVSALLIYRLIAPLHSVFVAALASLAWALSPVVLRINLNGMESGLYALVLTAFVTMVTRRLKAPDGTWNRTTPNRALMLTGVLAALCVMARLDAALLLAGLAVVLVSVALVRRDSRPLVVLFAIGAPTVIMLVVYMLFNQWQFGLPLPVSGLIKRPELPGALDAFLAQLLWPLGPVIRRIGVWPIACALGIGLLAVGGVATRSALLRALLAATFTRYDWLWVGCALLYAYISFSKTYIANWYYVPMFLLAALVFADLVAFAARFSFAPILKRTGAVALVAAITIGYTLLATAEFHPRKNDTIYETLKAAYWIRDTLPANAIGASWSAGVLAYFSERQVVNLDGLINSYEYYNAMRSGTAAQFAVGEGVDYVFDMFPVPPSGDTTNFIPDTAWAPYLRPYDEHRYPARNVGLSSLFTTIFPQTERDALFMWKVWQVQPPNS